MISAVELTNFKNVRHARVELGRLTVFVGPNGSGKTSVLQAIDLATRALRLRTRPSGQLLFPELTDSIGELRPAGVFQGGKHCDWLYSRGGTGDLAIACHTTDGDRYAVVARPPAGWPPASAGEFGRRAWDFRFEPADGDVSASVIQRLGEVRFMRLNVAALAAASYSTVTPPRMASNGKGLASVLAFMALNSPESFRGLTDELRKIIPTLRRIRFTRDTVRRVEREIVRFGKDTVVRPLRRSVQGDTILFDYDTGDNVSATLVSEGTLLLLGLLAVLLGPRRPRVLLLDDLDHGLHPRAQRALLNVLRALLEQFPDLQIASTAHSPYLLDGLHPDEVRLTTTDADGYSVCGKLTDHPDFDRWKDEMTPGELWSLFGEKWLNERGAIHG